TSSTWGREPSVDGNGRSVLRANGTNAWLVASGDLTFKLMTTQTTSGNPFLYRACRFDAESGFILAGRYLDPVAGRFITRGPQDRGNAFTFAKNNPDRPRAIVQREPRRPPRFQCGHHYEWWTRHN